jgi:MoxR-like ATPase
MKITVADPPREEKQRIVKNHATGFDPTDISGLAPVTSPDELLAMSALARRVRVDDAVVGYIARSRAAHAGGSRHRARRLAARLDRDDEGRAGRRGERGP